MIKGWERVDAYGMEQRYIYHYIDRYVLTATIKREHPWPDTGHIGKVTIVDTEDPDHTEIYEHRHATEKEAHEYVCRVVNDYLLKQLATRFVVAPYRRVI